MYNNYIQYTDFSQYSSQVIIYNSYHLLLFIRISYLFNTFNKNSIKQSKLNEAYKTRATSVARLKICVQLYFAKAAIRHDRSTT